MQPLRKNIIIMRIIKEQEGLIQGIQSTDHPLGKVLSIGSEVTMVKLEDMLLVDWRTAKHINGDLFSISEDDIQAIVD